MKSTTYHELPVLKEPVWKGWIPTYFFVGGVAGASAALGAAADLVELRSSRASAPSPLVRSARTLAAVGCVASAGLLIADLGRPARFLNMLRVFRPTSPMNVGTWILTAFGGASTAAAVLRSPVAGVTAGVLGLPLATYTAVLLSNTAVPVWNGARRTMPWLFAASAASSAASLLELLPARAAEEAAVRRLAIGGKLAELVGAELLTHEVAQRGRGPESEPLHRGRSGALWRAAKVATAASLVCELLPWRRSRAGAIAAGVSGSLGAALLRLALLAAGRASARDPRATFEPQRARRDARAALPAPTTSPRRVREAPVAAAVPSPVRDRWR